MSKVITTTVQQGATMYLSANQSQPKTTKSQERLIYNDRIESTLKDEFPMLKDNTYLDHAGMTLPSKRLVDSFAKTMASTIIGNPHSANVSSHLSDANIENIRLRALQMFDADPAHFDLIFVANATAGVKLVAEALREAPDGFDYIYHQSSHTSLLGLRQEARNSACLNDTDTSHWLAGGGPAFADDSQDKRVMLFSYPAQSNMNGSRLPLHWIRQSRSRYASRTCLTLLDAASFVSTTKLSLAVPEDAPDFTVFSFYKIFGFPDLGGLIVRKETASNLLLARKYFGGGTVEAVAYDTEEAWYARKSQTLHDALEDGTLPVHSIVALGIAIKTHAQLFGSMREVSLHTSYLADRLYSDLGTLRHENGAQLCVLYSPGPGQAKGPIVAFNLMTDTGSWVSPNKFQELAILQGFHIRTGGVCNPGGIAAALDLTAADVKRNFAEGYRCGGDDDMFRGRPAGVIRVSFGAMSTLSDVEKFSGFVREFYARRGGVLKTTVAPNMLSDQRCLADKGHSSEFTVKSITVFPIKSCQGFEIPRNTRWDVTAKGLAWDREWCLLDRATKRVMNQKRYPRMALLRPEIDRGKNVLTVSFCDSSKDACKVNEARISLPLRRDAALHEKDRGTDFEMTPSGIVGSTTLVHRYTSDTVNAFFSTALETPCTLARIAHLHVETKPTKLPSIIPGTFPNDADAHPAGPATASLSNESPILAINMSSVEQLNRQIQLAGAQPVPAESFRANIILKPAAGTAAKETAYAEDRWSRLRIGELEVEVQGPCQRCHMVCIDPSTATRRPEPYVTLSRTRRIGGKVVFGCHLAPVIMSGVATVKIGDVAVAETLEPTPERGDGSVCSKFESGVQLSR